MAFIAFCGVVTYTASLGGLRHAAYINPANLERIGLNSFIFQVLAIFAFGSAKVSVGCMILRLLPITSRYRRRTVRIVVWFTFVFNIANMIITFVQCSPPRALWEPNVPHTCWDPDVQLHIAYVGTGGLKIFILFILPPFGQCRANVLGMIAENIAVDIFLNFLPVSLVWGLRINKTQRLYLSVLLGMGSL